MSIWPRRPTEGQDQKYIRAGTLKARWIERRRRAKRLKGVIKTDPEKFEAALAAAIGPQAAKEYIGRQQRQKGGE
jgi:hypothetical protein